MANTKFISSFNYILIKNQILKRKILIWLSMESESTFIYLITSNIILALFMLLLSTFFIKEFYLKHINYAYKSGYLGEKLGFKILKKLPKNFTIFNQIEIPNENSSFNEFETDFIILGNNCLFIIEAKRYHGKVYCENEKEDWIKTFYNLKGQVKKIQVIKIPFKQVENQKLVLMQFLKSFNVNMKVFTLVFLNMDKGNYFLPQRCTIPVFNNKSINKYIKKIDRSESSFTSKNERDLTFEVLVNLNIDSIKSRTERLKDSEYLMSFLVNKKFYYKKFILIYRNY